MSKRMLLILLIIAIYTLGFLVAQIIKDLLAVRPRLDP